MIKSILFWTAIATALFLAACGILSLCGLEFRVWIREPITLLIAAGAAGGILQLLLQISVKPLKIFLIVVWAAALIAFCVFSFWMFALLHRSEISDNTEYNGVRCVVEHEPVMWESRQLYYEYLGLFVHGKEVLHKEGYACGVDD